MFTAFLLMFFRYWRHNLPDGEDLIWAKNIHEIAQKEEVGDTGRYNFGQKCVFRAAISTLLLLLASGIVIMVHIYAAWWVKGTLTAMVEGWTTSTWAKKHLPRWYRTLREQQKRPK